MDYKEFKKEASAFENNNKVLVEEYNDFTLVPFNKSYKELFKNYSDYNETVRNCTVAAFLKVIMNEAVSKECDMVEIVNNLFSKTYAIKDDCLSNNMIQIYFNDIKKVYDRNDNDYEIPYTLENRDKLIEMNLKSVITVAKAFRGKGIPFEDLINAGNYGLCKAFDKYDPDRAVAKEKMLEIINNLKDGELKSEDISNDLLNLCKYGNVKKKLKVYLTENKTTNKLKLKKWVESNVKNARFNSVAVMWIKASIIEELNNHSRPVKKPKSEIDKELHFNIEEGENPYKDKFLFLDDSVSPNSNNTIGETLYLPSDTISQEDRDCAMDNIKETFKILMEGIKARDRRIILQKFGIGYPRELTPKEIAEKENLSVARVCQIVNAVLDIMKKNQDKYNLDADLIWASLSNIY